MPKVCGHLSVDHRQWSFTGLNTLNHPLQVGSASLNVAEYSNVLNQDTIKLEEIKQRVYNLQYLYDKNM